MRRRARGGEGEYAREGAELSRRSGGAVQAACVGVSALAHAGILENPSVTIGIRYVFRIKYSRTFES